MNLAVHGASCRLYRQVRQFGSQDECVAFLAAWAFESAADTQCLISNLVWISILTQAELHNMQC